MLKEIKKKFLAASIVTIAIVIAVIVGSLNVFEYIKILEYADTTLATVIGDSSRAPDILGKIPGHKYIFPNYFEYNDGYFKVVFNNGETTVVNEKTSSVSDSTAISLAKTALSKGKNKGFSGRYRYMVSRNGSKTTVALIDCNDPLSSARSLLIISFFVSILGIIAVSLILWIISENIVRPISEGYEKQKRFITDAGHDIKTPLTVINADAELLEMEIGENEWLADIKKQTARLTTLTGDLIYLSKMEEKRVLPHADFPLSEVAEEVINSFGAPAKTKRINLNSYIAPALYYNGHADSIRKLITLLVDNAIKYSPEGATVDFSLMKQGRTITIKVSNQAPGLGVKAVEHMFDRFYRSDPSRSSSGGFGIGLSVAKAIVSSHKGRIYAHKQRDLLTIDVILF